MSHTNKTPFYELPQFTSYDKGTWLGDLNGAFRDIDRGMHLTSVQSEINKTDNIVLKSNVSNIKQAITVQNSTIDALEMEVNNVKESFEGFHTEEIQNDIKSLYGLVNNSASIYPVLLQPTNSQQSNLTPQTALCLYDGQTNHFYLLFNIVIDVAETISPNTSLFSVTMPEFYSATFTQALNWANYWNGNTMTRIRLSVNREDRTLYLKNYEEIVYNGQVWACGLYDIGQKIASSNGE